MNILNVAYPNQHADTEVTHGLKHHAITPDTIKTTFTLDLKPTDDKRHSTVNSVGRTLMKEKVLMKMINT